MYSIPTDTVNSISREISERVDKILDHVDASIEDCTAGELSIAVMKAATFTAEARMAMTTEVQCDDANLEDLGLKIHGTRHTTLLAIPTFDGPVILNEMFDQAAEAVLRAGPAPWELPAITRAEASPEHHRLYEELRIRMRANGIPARAMRGTIKAETEPWIWELGMAAVLHARHLGIDCSTWSNGKRVVLLFSSEDEQSVAVMHHEKMKATLDEVACGAAAAMAAVTSPRPIAA